MRTLMAFLMLCCSIARVDSQTKILVSPEWVAANAKDPKLVLVQVSANRKEYLNGHIPGARFLWWEHLSPSNPDESTSLPSIDVAKRILEELGISNDSRVILYGGPGVVTLVTRTYVMFEYLGLGHDVSILNGGLDAWKADHRPIETGMPNTAVVKGTVRLTVQPGVVADLPWVKENLRNPSVAIVDGRAKAAYDGRTGGLQKSGHIAGAKNVPFSSIVDSLSRFKPVDSLAKSFTDAGIKSGSKVVTYCWVGQQATVTYYAAKMLGYDVSLFDGSWEIWSAMDDSYPTEITTAPKVPAK